MIIISRIASAALIHFYNTAFSNAFPYNYLSSEEIFKSIAANILSIYSISAFIMHLVNRIIGSKINAQNPLFNTLPLSLYGSVFHFFVSLS